MEHLIVAIGVLAVIWILINHFITLPTPGGQILNIVFAVILIILLLRAFIPDANAACSTQQVCD